MSSYSLTDFRSISKTRSYSEVFWGSGPILGTIGGGLWYITSTYFSIIGYCFCVCVFDSTEYEEYSDFS